MKLAITSLLILFVAGCLFFAVSWVNELRNKIEEGQRGNTISWVAAMIVSHLESNDDSWPRDWDDLNDEYETVVCEFSQPWLFRDLKSNVQVDWDVDVDEVRRQIRSGTREFNVIRMNGDPPHLERVDEANESIFFYIRYGLKM